MFKPEIHFYKLLVVSCLFMIAMTGFSRVRLPAILQSNMVLQQQTEVKLWGWAEPDEKIKISVSWQKQKLKTRANQQGAWMVKVRTREAGGPYKIKIRGKNTIRLENILFGEVWLCSGQSNMDFTINMLGGWEDDYFAEDKLDFEKLGYPDIRLFDVANKTSDIPEADCSGTWSLTSLKRLGNFSAVAYFFGRKLKKEMNVPIGLIVSSWGGTSAQAWTNPNEIDRNPLLETYRYDPAKKYSPQAVPGSLYNGMIHPLLNLSFRGVIWYQGEANRNDAETYADLFPAMINSWREDFQQGTFPFYYVQIAPFRYAEPMVGALIREAQLKSLSTPNTGMAVTLDIGNFNDIHPVNKQEVGRRLALLALAQTYGFQDIVYSGPVFKKAFFEESPWLEGLMGARLEFTHIGSGLELRDDVNGSFMIAGSDGVFKKARARIMGDELYVWSTEIREPKAVRYAFENTPHAVLFNNEGLPASSFRTDNFKIITAGVDLEIMNINPGKSVAIQIITKPEGLDIRYTLNGTDPDRYDPLYSGPVKLDRTSEIRARAYDGNVPSEMVARSKIHFHLAAGRPINPVTIFSQKYPARGSETLVDGLRGTNSYNDGQWLGYEGNDLEVIIDLENIKAIKRISAGFLQSTPAWVFLPEQVVFYSSTDDEVFNPLGSVNHRENPKLPGTIIYEFELEPGVDARFIKVKAKNMGVCPSWHPGAGGKAWIFCDEIIVE